VFVAAGATVALLRGGDHIKPQHVIRELQRLTNGDAIIATDVGQHQMWAAQFYPFKRERQWITSGGLGTMGFGVPAASARNWPFAINSSSQSSAMAAFK